MNMKKTLLSAAIVSALGVTTSANADMVAGTWSGVFTMLGAGGTFTDNPDSPGGAWSGHRSDITGTLTFDTATGAGTGTVVPFSFFGSGVAIATTITFQAIGDGMGGPGALVLGNMGFNWNGNNGIPVSIVMDASGFFGNAAFGLSVSQTLTGGTFGALGASDNTETDIDGMPGGTTFPIGPTLMGTTIHNTTAIGTPALGTNPSGTLPLVTDTVVDSTNGDTGIGGSPMPTAPFPGFNANFDITSMHVTSCVETGDNPGPNPTAGCAGGPPAVPVPAAVWLFGSGLLGLAGIARRKKRNA
jgi:hypothetical protein